jgi:triacylglycerol lipase
VAVPLQRPPVPPLWLEGRFALEWAGLLRSEVWRGEGVPPGERRAVLLIPGFLAGDGTLSTMTQWLRASGYRTQRAGIRRNVDCSEESCGRIEQRLEALAERRGERVAIVGHSRGGVFARALAARRPDLVSGIVTLGAPVLQQLAVHPLVLVQIAAVAALGWGRVPGLFTWSCLRGDCCEEFRAALKAPFPPGVGYVAVYSRSDGVVDWRSCLDPDADAHVEVAASHCGMSVNAHVYRALAAALARFAASADLPEAA